MSYTSENNKVYLRKRYIAQRRHFIEYLGSKCAKCGCTKNLHIDHINPKKKSFAIGKLWAVKDLPMVYRELKKCQLLCEGCHVKKTSRENSYERGWTHGTVYAWMKKKCNCDICSVAKERYRVNRNAKRRKPGGYGKRLTERS